MCDVARTKGSSWGVETSVTILFALAVFGGRGGLPGADSSPGPTSQS